MAFGGPLLAVLASVLGVALAVLLIMFVLVPLFRGIGWGIKQVFNFVVGEVGDALRIVGAVITNAIFVPLTVGSIVIGRWSAAAHFGRAIQSEFKTMGACVYRIAIGHPARLLCLTALTDGIEKRLPEVVAATPGADKPNKHRTGQFDGYTIVGSLPGGGSGGRLYVAQPDELKLAGFARNGAHDVGQVVIKAFSLRDGSSLPQIVRESRALDAAKKLGLVLEHELTDERFFYVTRYVPGESLGLVTQRLHAASPAEGLGHSQLRQAMSCAADLLQTLDVYHRGGLWHKDVKPDNIIVDRQAAHLVDFGLVTHLRSAMTLTTHGTEYFRDPEMVRLALKGVKVHQVDGAKFDIYAAGAVLFSVIENSFPAHGGLSQVTKKCPEALRWIIRRAMTEYDRRYPSASLMLADLEAVRQASDPFAVRPADLPSMKQGEPVTFESLPQDPIAAVGVGPAAAAVGMAGLGAAGFAAPAAVAAGMGAMGAQAAAAGAGAAFGSPVPPAAEEPRGRMRPRIRVAGWWTGKYDSDGVDAVAAPPPGSPGRKGGFVFRAGFRDGRPFLNVDRGEGEGAPPPPPPGAPGSPVPPRPRHVVHKSAAEQLESARARVEAARERARHRMQSRRARQAAARGQNFQAGFNPGVAAALFVFLGGCVALVGGVLFAANGGFSKRESVQGPGGTRAFAMMHLPIPPAPASAPTSRPAAAAPEGERTRIELVSPGKRLVAPVDGTVLIVNNVQLVGASEDTRRAIEFACEQIRSLGCEVVGNYPGNPASEEIAAVQDELVTEATYTLGMTPPDSEEAKVIVGEWLTQTGNADLLIWLGPDLKSESKVSAYFFSPIVDPREHPTLAKRINRLADRANGMLGLK